MNIGVWKNLILSVISLSNAEWNNNSHFTNLNLLQTTGTMIIGNFCIECHLHLHSISTNELSFNVWMDGWMDGWMAPTINRLHVATRTLYYELTRRQKAKKYQLVPIPVLEME
jgi:hypothetical protein